jgi:single-stranded-DNA-specific exonuclease
MAWQVAERETERGRALAMHLGVTPVTAHLLIQRGHDDPAAARSFLEPTLAELVKPAGLPDIEAGAARVLRAITSKEKVLLFGDYDVDGTTGSVILHEVLTALGGDVEVHIPDRSEGYGLNAPRLERAIADGVKLVISIDTGVTAVAEADLLAARGVDFVVCDHHTLGATLPKAVAIIHPRLPSSTYANPNLCGAGVAFKLAWAVAELAGGGKMAAQVKQVVLRCVAFVALGTVADVVPLVGENRTLVRWGLRGLRGAGEGMRALLGAAGMQELLEWRGGEVPDRLQPSATDIGFRLAPRLNAAGRMGSARRAFQLLVTKDPVEAAKLAKELDEENGKRRALQDRVYREAVAQVLDVYGDPATPEAPLRRPGIVAWHEGWPHGIVGIVAAKLTERFKRPALVASVESPDKAKGSGRTCGDVDLLRALEPGKAHLQRFGGHAAACGFTADPKELDGLRAAFDHGVVASLGLPVDTPLHEVAARLEGYEVVADAQLELGEVSRQLVDELDKLAPFGEGNAEPVFTARGVTLVGQPRPMGAKGEHVSVLLRQGSTTVRAVAFGREDLLRLLMERARPGPNGPAALDVAFRPKRNTWNGETKIELELEDLRLVEAPDDVER